VGGGGGGGGGGGDWIGFGSSDFAEKIVRILDLGICYKYSRILFIQQIAYLSYILAQVVDFTCNLVRILDCDFIVELLADPDLDKTIVGSPPLPIRGDLHGRKYIAWSKNNYAAPGQLEQRYSELFDYVLLLNATMFNPCYCK
jgi:hypothetical protein